jgi:hypothetical protein
MIPEPNWQTEAPKDAFHAVLRASELASVGDQAGCCQVLAESPVDQRQLAICGVRSLAGLIAGPGQDDRLTQIRSDIMALAADADKLVIVTNAEVLNMAEAWLAGDIDQLDKITGSSHIPASDHACVACQLAGQFVAYVAGEHTREVFESLRTKYGIGGPQ